MTILACFLCNRLRRESFSIVVTADWDYGVFYSEINVLFASILIQQRVVVYNYCYSYYCVAQLPSAPACHLHATHAFPSPRVPPFSIGTNRMVEEKSSGLNVINPWALEREGKEWRILFFFSIINATKFFFDDLRRILRFLLFFLFLTYSELFLITLSRNNLLYTDIVIKKKGVFVFYQFCDVLCEKYMWNELHVG